MEAIIRAVAMYLFLLVVFRVTGRRTLGESTTFDLLLLLVISETTQQAMVGEDHSMTYAFLLIITFLAVNVLLSVVKQYSHRVERVLEDVPLIIVEHGRPLKDRMDRARVDEADVLEAAREVSGVERLDQIKYAVLERSGKISVITSEPH
jgi:uncharacterized membrane protein YcaP (DUF421 family)